VRLQAELSPLTPACRQSSAQHDLADLLSRSPNAEFLDQRLPASRLVIIDAGHFVWEEEPAKYASAVLDSITGNWP
jgi:pimeloyl-ACP methyl ester carboxylesterase